MSLSRCDSTTRLGLRACCRAAYAAPRTTVNFPRSLFVDGWDRLIIIAKDNSRAGAFSAGFAEGAATHASIHSMFVNNYADWFGDGKGSPGPGFNPSSTYAWLEKNWEWTKSRLLSIHVCLAGTGAGQMKAPRTVSSGSGWVPTSIARGMVAGYNHAAPSLDPRRFPPSERRRRC